MRMTRKEPGLWLRGGRWYIDAVVNGSRVRKSTGTSNFEEAKKIRDSAFAKAEELNAAKVLNGLYIDRCSEWEGFCDRLKQTGVINKKFLDLRRSAKQRNIKFEFTLETLYRLIRRCNGKCELTGITLEISTEYRHPFKMSIDRIDNDGPYSPANCRVLALCVNVAIGEWGEQVLAAIALGYTQLALVKAEANILSKLQSATAGTE